jgi:hypothetical protein
LSNPDSFIDEVTEAVRRDRLFALFRRYGWIGITAIVLIVGYSAWSEWSKSREAQMAQAFGDAVGAALSMPTPDARTAALDAIATERPEQKAVLTYLKGAEPGAGAALENLTDTAGLPPVWRDIAEFKRLIGATELDAKARRARFEALTRPGAAMRLLAEEQIALIDAEAGDRAAAIERLTRLSTDTEASADLRRRAAQLIVALGGAPGG